MQNRSTKNVRLFKSFQAPANDNQQTFEPPTMTGAGGTCDSVGFCRAPAENFSIFSSGELDESPH